MLRVCARARTGIVYLYTYAISFPPLHEMPARISDEKGVRLSVCLSVCPSVRLTNACIVTKRKKDLSTFYIIRKIIQHIF